jgi:hypothetical protein
MVRDEEGVSSLDRFDETEHAFVIVDHRLRMARGAFYPPAFRTVTVRLLKRSPSAKQLMKPAEAFDEFLEGV